MLLSCFVWHHARDVATTRGAAGAAAATRRARTPARRRAPRGRAGAPVDADGGRDACGPDGGHGRGAAGKRAAMAERAVGEPVGVRRADCLRFGGTRRHTRPRTSTAYDTAAIRRLVLCATIPLPAESISDSRVLSARRCAPPLPAPPSRSRAHDVPGGDEAAPEHRHEQLVHGQARLRPVRATAAACSGAPPVPASSHPTSSPRATPGPPPLAASSSPTRPTRWRRRAAAQSRARRWTSPTRRCRSASRRTRRRAR